MEYIRVVSKPANLVCNTCSSPLGASRCEHFRDNRGHSYCCAPCAWAGEARHFFHQLARQPLPHTLLGAALADPLWKEFCAALRPLRTRDRMEHLENWRIFQQNSELAPLQLEHYYSCMERDGRIVLDSHGDWRIMW